MNFTGKRECGQSRLCITYVCTGANNGKNKSNLYINGKKCFEKLLPESYFPAYIADSCWGNFQKRGKVFQIDTLNQLRTTK